MSHDDEALRAAVTGKDEVAAAARLKAAQAEARLLRAELAATQVELGKAMDVRSLIEAAAQAMAPPPAWHRPRTRKRPTVTAMVLYGDAHAGERTDPRATEGWGVYNYAIAQARTLRYLEALTRWLTTQRAGYRIDEVAVILLGDMVSGDIHDELRCTAEFPAPVQAIAAGRLVAMLVSGLAAQARRVVVYGVAGSNHGRLTKKPQFKQGALNNWDWVVYEYARALLAQHGNVAVDVLPAKKHLVQVAGHGFLCAHGDAVRAWMGIPWYGIEREIGREARRRLERMNDRLRRELPVEGLYEYGLGAHWHTPFVGPGFRYIVNGSLSGTNEYDHSAGRHAAPQQVAALVSPKHGMFGPVAWRLDHSSEADLAGVDSTAIFAGSGV